MRGFRILRGHVGSVGLGSGSSWRAGCRTSPTMVYGAQSKYGGYVYLLPPAVTTSMGGQWTLPTPAPATNQQVNSGAKVYGGLSEWIGVQDTDLAQTGTSTSEFPPALTAGRRPPFSRAIRSVPGSPMTRRRTRGRRYGCVGPRTSNARPIP